MDRSGDGSLAFRTGSALAGDGVIPSNTSVDGLGRNREGVRLWWAFNVGLRMAFRS